MFDPLSILSFFAPVLVDAGKAIVNKYVGPPPLTPEQQTAVSNADTEKLKALAALDAPGEGVSWWVSDIRALMRPFVAVVVTLTWCVRPADVDVFMVSSVWFYLFGERSLNYARGK